MTQGLVIDSAIFGLAVLLVGLGVFQLLGFIGLMRNTQYIGLFLTGFFVQFLLGLFIGQKRSNFVTSY